MEYDIGPQYARDNTADPGGFLAAARLHQSQFRANHLFVPFEKYGNYFNRTDAEQGSNFYPGFEIFEAVQARYPKYNKGLYANMLRSEHIPFNLFIPLRSGREFAAKVFSYLLGKEIRAVDRIEIEWAPQPKEKYLNDLTSFDAYVEYTTPDSRKGILGIEVKYTERAYPLTEGSKEERFVNDETSPYFEVTNASGIYHDGCTDRLKTDEFRQLWRNQLLGESMLLRHPEEYDFFTSMHFYPSGNVHFNEVCPAYMEMLRDPVKNFIPVTFERYIEVCRAHATAEFSEWIEYLEKRYIVM